jgi:hypothetical protein
MKTRIRQNARSAFLAALLFAEFAVSVLRAQEEVALQLVADAPNLMKAEGVDAGSGIHYVRLMQWLPAAEGSTEAPPRFSMECTEDKDKRDLSWFASFGGVKDFHYTPPFQPTQAQPFPPRNPNAHLKMTFEGYMKWKPYERMWEVLPSGELRYRNPGLSSPNMENPRYFLQYLNSLPGLRIGYAKPGPATAESVLFPTRAIQDQMQKIPICKP